MKRNLFLMICLLYQAWSFAQDKNADPLIGFTQIQQADNFFPAKVITFNRPTLMPDADVPFDQDLFLKIPVPVDSSITIKETTKVTLTSDNVPPIVAPVTATKTVNETETTSSITLPVPRQTIDSISIDRYHENTAQSTQVSQYRIIGNDLFIRMDRLRPSSYYELIVNWGSPVRHDTVKFSTIPADMTNRAKQRLTSEFGVVNVMFKNGEKIDHDLTLCFTVLYNFRPVNKDVPLKSYGFLHPRRFSALLGVTINPLAREGIRSDLFAKNNLMLGFSYQLVDLVRFAYGGLLFQHHNPNPLLNDQKRVVATQYAGVTIDLSIKELFGGILGILNLK